MDPSPFPVKVGRPARGKLDLYTDGTFLRSGLWTSFATGPNFDMKGERGASKLGASADGTLFHKHRNRIWAVAETPMPLADTGAVAHALVLRALGGTSKCAETDAGKLGSGRAKREQARAAAQMAEPMAQVGSAQEAPIVVVVLSSSPGAVSSGRVSPPHTARSPPALRPHRPYVKRGSVPQAVVKRGSIPQAVQLTSTARAHRPL